MKQDAISVSVQQSKKVQHTPNSVIMIKWDRLLPRYICIYVYIHKVYATMSDLYCCLHYLQTDNKHNIHFYVVSLSHLNHYVSLREIKEHKDRVEVNHTNLCCACSHAYCTQSLCNTQRSCSRIWKTVIQMEKRYSSFSFGLPCTLLKRPRGRQ